jgi:hypothetical protein
MLTIVAFGSPRISGPIPYAWVFLVVFLALIALIFFRVYGRGGQSGRQAGHHSRRRAAHKSGHEAAHNSGHETAHSVSHVPERGESHGHRAASRRRHKRP